MTPLFDLAASLSEAPVWSMLLLDAGLKGSLLLLLAGLFSLALRPASAAARHLVWTLALGALLLLPLLAATLPTWTVPLLPASLATPSPSTTPTAPAPTAPDAQSLPAMSPSPSTSSTRATEAPLLPAHRNHDPASFTRATPWAVPTPPNSPSISRFTWVLLVWGSGAVFVLGRLLLGLLGIRWLARRALPITDTALIALTARLRHQLGLKRPIQLLRGALSTTPMTWGMFRPVILLPATVDTWSTERRRIVLLHELAHIKRWDYGTQRMAQLACGIYWFNPLVWLAANRSFFEQEQACDDQVVLGGIPAGTYARHLVAIARSLRPVAWSSGAVTMTRRTVLESRLLALLKPDKNRCGVSPGHRIASGLLAIGLLVPLAAMAPGRTPVNERHEAPSPHAPVVTQVRPDTQTAVAPAPQAPSAPAYPTMSSAEGRGPRAGIRNLG